MVLEVRRCSVCLFSRCCIPFVPFRQTSTHVPFAGRLLVWLLVQSSVSNEVVQSGEEAATAYKPYRLQCAAKEQDWVAALELDSARAFLPNPASSGAPKVLVLYGSLRQRSYSLLLAYEFAR